MNETLNYYKVVTYFDLPTEYHNLWEDISTHDFHPEKAEAVIVVAGLLDYDLNLSMSRWQKDLKSFKNRFIAGIHTEIGQTLMTQLATENPDWATWQISADNHPIQAQWAIQQLQDNNVNSVAIYAPLFHLPRAVMTLIQAAKNADWTGKIYPFGWQPDSTEPLALHGFDNQVSHEALIPGEQQRLVFYTEKGDVASPENWSEFRPNT